VVKVIADFPDLAAGTDAEATYRIDAIARLVVAAHDAGARVAVHSTVPGAGQPVAAGVDSVEHGFGLDQHAIREMADRGTAWTPTVGALLAPAVVARGPGCDEPHASQTHARGRTEPPRGVDTIRCPGGIAS
jgi:imidazolonepropionase-like amidohydrolase